MKDVAMFMKSGMLELYVLGDLSQTERLLVVNMASTHQHIKGELNEIESALEQYASINAIEPEALLRNKILDTLFIH